MKAIKRPLSLNIKWLLARSDERAQVGGRKGSREVVALFRNGPRKIYFIWFEWGKKKSATLTWTRLLYSSPNTWQEEDAVDPRFSLGFTQKKRSQSFSIALWLVSQHQRTFFPSKKIKKSLSIYSLLVFDRLIYRWRLPLRITVRPSGSFYTFFRFLAAFEIHPSPSIDYDVTFNYVNPPSCLIF